MPNYFTLLLTAPKKALHHIVNIAGIIRLFNQPNDCLYTAIETNSPFWTKVAIKFGADINGNYGRSLTALHLAAKMGKTEIVRLLINQYHADINATDDIGRTPLYLAFQRGKTKTAQTLVDEFNANINTTNQWGESPLHLATKRGNISKIRLLIKQYQVDVNFPDKFGKTPLHYAVRANNYEVLKLLIEECNAAVSIKNNRGISPLHLAAKKGYLDIVNYFLDLPEIKINPDVGHDVAANNNSALYKAVELGDLATVNRLLCFDEVVKELTAHDNAILRIAQTNKHDAIASRLMELTSVRKDEKK